MEEKNSFKVLVDGEYVDIKDLEGFTVEIPDEPEYLPSRNEVLEKIEDLLRLRNEEKEIIDEMQKQIEEARNATNDFPNAFELLEQTYNEYQQKRGADNGLQ